MLHENMTPIIIFIESVKDSTCHICRTYFNLKFEIYNIPVLSTKYLLQGTDVNKIHHKIIKPFILKQDACFNFSPYVKYLMLKFI